MASAAAVLAEFGISAAAVPFDCAVHDALCAAANEALTSLIELKRYWR
jgi:hypothetical protein